MGNCVPALKESNEKNNKLVGADCLLPHQSVSGMCRPEIKSLSRSRALDLLREHKEFKTTKAQPLRDVEKFNIPALSEDEDPVPYERAVQTYFENYADMGVFREFGLVEAEATLTDRPQMLRPTGTLLGWALPLKSILTIKLDSLTTK